MLVEMALVIGCVVALATGVGFGPLVPALETLPGETTFDRPGGRDIVWSAFVSGRFLIQGYDDCQRARIRGMLTPNSMNLKLFSGVVVFVRFMP